MDFPKSHTTDNTPCYAFRSVIYDKCRAERVGSSSESHFYENMLLVK